MKRGYYAVGIYEPKTVENMGTLWRSAHNFGANFIFTIGNRYHEQRTDTTKAKKHIPTYYYRDWQDFLEHLPSDCDIVCVEQCSGSQDLKSFIHPERAIYILGAEDYGIPEDKMRGHRKVYINTPMCLNVAVAGSIIMYDRKTKQLEEIK